MNILIIMKKELLAYILSPTIYAVITIFMVLSSYFFYTDLSFYNTMNIAGTANPVEGLFQFYFNDLRFILMLIMPFLTMRLLSEEKKQKTLELLCSYPIRDFEILAGKFLSCFLVYLFMIFLTLINVLYICLQWGFEGFQPLLAGYLGLSFLGLCLISCGLFISSLTEKQIVAGMGTLGIFVLFWFLTWNEMMAGEKLINFLTRLSLFDRLEFFFKGVIDTQDLVFFSIFIIIFICFTLFSMKSRKLEV